MIDQTPYVIARDVAEVDSSTSFLEGERSGQRSSSHCRHDGVNVAVCFLLTRSLILQSSARLLDEKTASNAMTARN